MNLKSKNHANKKKHLWGMVLGAILCIYFFNLNRDILVILHQYKKFTCLFTQNKDFIVLPVETQEILSLMRAYQLKDFQLSSGIKTKALTEIDTVYAAWPKRLELNSNSLFMTRAEAERKTPYLCKIKELRNEVAYAQCDLH